MRMQFSLKSAVHGPTEIDHLCQNYPHKQWTASFFLTHGIQRNCVNILTAFMLVDIIL